MLLIDFSLATVPIRKATQAIFAAKSLTPISSICQVVEISYQKKHSYARLIWCAANAIECRALRNEGLAFVSG